MGTFKKMFFFLISILFFSCNDGESDNLIENDNELWELPKEVNFMYKDKSYYSECIIIDNTTSYILDNEVREVLEYLNQQPNLSKLVINDLIEYYDSYEEVCEKYNLVENFQTKGLIWKVPLIYNAEVELYENTNFGKHMSTYSTTSRLTLSTLPKNNKLSSLKLRAYIKEVSPGEINFTYTKQEAYVTLYENTNFIGKSLTFILPNNVTASQHTLSIPNLKNFDYNDDKSWNDKASSLILGIRVVL